MRHSRVLYPIHEEVCLNLVELRRKPVMMRARVVLHGIGTPVVAQISLPVVAAAETHYPYERWMLGARSRGGGGGGRGGERTTVRAARSGARPLAWLA